jgi:lysophospholipase L1-like esterase
VIGPYALWVFVVEREIFSRLPLVLVSALFLLALQVYFAGARDWLLRRKPLRARLTLTLLALAFGLMSLVLVPSVLLCIGLCELAYRFAPVRRSLGRIQHRGAQLAVTAVLVLVLFPAMNAMYGFQGGLRQLSPLLLMRNPFYEINADGLRGPRLRREKPPGLVRLLFLGDSSTFGWPYRYEDAYPDLVRQRLAEHGLGSVEVIDAGIPSQTIVQIGSRLESQLEYDPDLVFLMDGVHFEKSLDQLEDARRYSGSPEEHGFRPRFFPPTLIELGLLGVASNPLLAPCRRRPDPATARERAALNERIAAQYLSRLVDAVRRRGVPLIILEYPSRSVPPPVREQQRQAARGAGVSWLPLLHLFPDASCYSLHDGIHPDKAGHRRIAAAIVDDLLTRGWPPRPNRPRPDQRPAAPNR